MRPSFVAALCEAAKDDPRIFLLCGDLGFSALEPFRDAFPTRYVNVGVAEQNMTGIAAGMARTGKIVFTYSIANFPTLRCLEQIRDDVCYHAANVKVVSVGAGFSYASQGYTHHGVEDIAIMRTLPGMTVVSPGDPLETKLATRAIIEKPGPCYLRLGKAGEPILHAGSPKFELGKAIQMTDGADLTLITTGTMLKDVLDLATRLRAGGIGARVLSMHTIAPLDEAAVHAAARETKAILTIEEHTVVGGLGSAVADVLAEMDGPRAVFKKVGIPAGLYHDVGSQKYMRRLLGDLDTLARGALERARAL